MTYDIKFREKVLKHMRENELKPKEVSVLFSIGLNTVRRRLKNITPKVCKRKPWKLDMEKLRADIEEYPDGYQYERAKRLGVGQNAIFHGLKRLGISYKKNIYTDKQTQNRYTNCAWYFRWVCQTVIKLL
jgi:transposase